jgi:hypothetical protein
VRGDFCWYWWNCWPSINVLRWEVIFVDIGVIVDHHSMYWGERWLVMVNNSTNINKNHLAPQFIEWWSTIPPISTKMTSRLNSLSDSQQFHQYQQKSYLTSTLTITQCIEMRVDFCWYWWNCLPSLNEFRWEVIFVDIGGIVDHHSMSWGERWYSLSDGQQFHQYQQKSPRTSIHWVMVNNSTNINKNHLSPQFIEW